MRPAWTTLPTCQLSTSVVHPDQAGEIADKHTTERPSFGFIANAIRNFLSLDFKMHEAIRQSSQIPSSSNGHLVCQLFDWA